jgi:predicted nucleotidyltransferase
MNRLAAATPSSAAPVNEALLRQLADEIRKEIPEAEARLFGSQARGEARPDSAIDLLITVTDDWLADHNRFVDLLVVERTPHLEGEAKLASWWRHFAPLQPLRLPVDLIVSGNADAARHGRVLVVRP